MKIGLRSIFFVVAASTALNVFAAQPRNVSAARPASGPVFGLVIGGALEFGGDKVATVSFEDGDTQNIRAGQGLSGLVGGTIHLDAHSPWSARATVGYKYNTTKASNADISLGRVPLELIGTYEFGSGGRLGTGLVYHTGIKLNGDGFFDDVKFNGAAGFKLEAGWKWIVVSYTNLKYHVSNGSGSADASNLGVTFLWEFWGR